MNDWSIVFEDWSPQEQPRREALLATGNGYFVTRAADETRRAGGVHYPGTYLAGGYNRAVSHIAGRAIENEDLVNFPNWLFLTFRAGQREWFDVDRAEVLSHQQELDLKRGLLIRRMRFRDDAGDRWTLTSRRLVSMDDMHFGAIDWALTSEDYEGRLEIRSEIDGRIRNENVERYKDLNSDHFEVERVERIGEEVTGLAARTHQSRLRVAMAARLRVTDGGVVERKYIDQGDRVGEEVVVACERGETIRVEKVVAVYNSRDMAISEPLLAAGIAATRAPSFEALRAAHERAWARIWQRADLELENKDQLRILRLHVFHLVQTASPPSAHIDAGIPARGWTGEAYRGHVLWDELFIFPLINMRAPEVTRSLLLYRYRRLGEARAAAAEEGRSGAKFPWQSGSDGREESQEIHLNPESGEWIPDLSSRQRHINLAIAYNVWQYFDATGDCEFLTLYGAEMLIEIARYMADRAEFDEADGRCHIRGVMGPDEFHERYPGRDEPGLDDNAYTNVMTSWLLERMSRLFDVLGDRCCAELHESLGLRDEELESWAEISERLYVPFVGERIIAQFAGWEDLEELDWDRYREKYGDIERLDRILKAEGDSPDRYKVNKQADTLMLFYLLSSEEVTRQMRRLGYDFEPSWIRENVEYYLDRTSHGSTLSRIVYAWLLARTDRARSYDLFVKALHSDIDDIQGGTTPEGIHLGAMAGTVDLVHRCYTGIELRDDALRLNPKLPEEMKGLRLQVVHRGLRYGLRISKGRLEIEASSDWPGPATVRVRDDEVTLAPGQRASVDLD